MFDVSQWRSACVSNIEIPAEVQRRMAIDPSLTANEQSDHSSIGFGFLDEDTCLTVTDLRVGKWRGIELPFQIVKGIEEFKPQQIDIERIPGTDLLVDVVKLKAKEANIVIERISTFSSCSPKPSRIRQLQGLLDRQMLKFHYGPFVEMLFQQVESYLFTPSNSGRSDDALDVCAMLAGFR